MLTVKKIEKFDCDVIIAGGGPAGSGLAFHLASSGIHVIVVEAESFPRDKVCGDGVSPLALAEMKKMGITQSDHFKQANEIKQVGLFIKNDTVFIQLSKPENLPFHARIIPRLALDHWISDAAKKAGAQFVEQTRITGYRVNDDGVMATLKQGFTQYNLKAKIIIGADGSSSTISRQLNGNKPKDEYQLLGLRAYYKNVNGPSDRVDIYFAEDSFPGIFWMFPIAPDGANIGMALVSKTLPTKPSHVKELLLQHINNNPAIKERIGHGIREGKIQGWPITFYNHKSLLYSDRVLLVGEAAGLINPLSGDGIQYALLSANWASEVIVNCIKNNEFTKTALVAYKTKVDKELGFDFALSNLLIQFPRNKSFSKIWMSILEIMIARAKKDKDYADIIAGIFEGTYPSYTALTVPFIFKSLKEGSRTLTGNILKYLKSPEGIPDTLLHNSNNLASLFDELKAYRKENIEWMKATAGKTFTLSSEMINHWVKKNE